MSVGLYLRAKVKSSPLSRLLGEGRSVDKVLKDIEKWVLHYCTDLCPDTQISAEEGQPTLFCSLHPAAENISISFPDPQHLVVSANTSTVGPGYHIFVCDMLHKLGERFGAIWEEPNEGEYYDETGYFHYGDQENVFAEMTAWLRGLARMFFDGTLKDTDHPVRLAMPLDSGFNSDSRAITPMGPRDTDWLQQTANNGNDGRDFFAWWTPGLNAEYFLGRAMAKMWTDARWRKPVNDSEREALRYISHSLETAYKLNPNLLYPWAEWAEVLKLLEDREAEHDFVRQSGVGTPTIGYRQRDVRVQLPGHWWITLPGSFSDFAPDAEALCAKDPPKTVWYSGYKFTGDIQQSFAHWRSETLNMPHEFLREDDDCIGEAQIKSNVENGEEHFALTSSNICHTGRCILTVVFTRPDEREWAIGVWKSLKASTQDSQEGER